MQSSVKEFHRKCFLLLHVIDGAAVMWNIDRQYFLLSIKFHLPFNTYFLLSHWLVANMTEMHFIEKNIKKKKKRGWQIVGHLRTRSPKPCSSDNSEGRCVGSDQKEMCVGMFVHESTRSNDSLRWQWERRSFKRAGFPEQGSTQQGSWWHLHSLWDQQP